MKATEEARELLGVKSACQALGVPRATFYRRRKRAECLVEPPPRPTPPRALSAKERQEVLEELHSERFADKAPAEVYAALLDDGRYLCSVRTMYRILEANGEVRERRNQLRHPVYAVPKLVAEAPNQVWTWDITKLLGPKKWEVFHLYVLLDLYSRYVVGWRLARRESGRLARELIEETCGKQAVHPGQLTVHSDRGAAMTSKTLALLFADLGISKSLSRPRVSNDNPYSESHFKTLKYRPGYPQRFGSLEDGRAWCREFFRWYNNEHYHSGLGSLTPYQVHYGRAELVLERRREVLDAAYTLRPERFVRGKPTPAQPPQQVWINEPAAFEIACRPEGPAERDCGKVVGRSGRSVRSLPRAEISGGPELSTSFPRARTADGEAISSGARTDRQ